MKYYIYQAEGNANFNQVATVTDQKTYTATGLKANTTYRFAVSSYNGIRESAKSNIITITTANIPVSGITLSIDRTTLEVGDKAKVSITVTPANQTSGIPILNSSNTNVLKVDNDGNVVAVGTGSATITASLNGVRSNVISMTVYDALVDVSNLKVTNVTATSALLTWN